MKYLWSITIYSIPHACSWRTRSIGSSTPGLKTNEDGSLTIQAEAAFRTGKSDLWLRPVVHQKTERVEAHLLVCFLTLLLWRTLEMWMRGKGLGTCARQLLKEVATVRSMDVILPTQRPRRSPSARRRQTRPPRGRAPPPLGSDPAARAENCRKCSGENHPPN